MIGQHLIKSWSKQQKVIALSSAEADTYAEVGASCEAFGVQACASDLGMDLAGEIFADALAALGIIARTGRGCGQTPPVPSPLAAGGAGGEEV